MARKFLLRIDDELDKPIENEAKVRAISENELINQAIKHFLSCKKSESETPTLKPIIVKYPSNCKQCGQPIPIGSRALWGKGIIVCIDCHVTSLGDKALASKYLRMRELNKIVKALEKEANQYADFINEIKLQVKFAEYLKKLSQLLNLNEVYLKTLNEDTIKQMQQLYQELQKDLPEIKLAITTKMQPITKTKKVSYET